MNMPGDIVIGDDGFLEIVGEQTRGGTPAANTLTPILGLDPRGAYELLGQMVSRSPQFNQYAMDFAAKRAAMARPMVHQVPLQKARDWHIDIGPVSGAAGTSTTITVQPQCLYRGEKLMATDTGSPVGYGTRIGQIAIGQKLQRPVGGGSTLTFFFANTTLGNGIKWDTCKEALSISMTISFVQSCTFDATVFGKAVT